MKNENISILEGFLLRDPEVAKSKKGSSYLKFSIAINGYGTGSYSNYLKKDELVSFFDVIVWDDLADKVSPKLKKGTKVKVVGHLSQWRWKDDSGKSHSKINILAEYVDFPFTKKNSKPI